MTTAEKREAWRTHCRRELEHFGVDIRTTASGAMRLTGWHADLTLVDLADMTPTELRDFTRIRT